MRKILVILPLIAMIAGCSDRDNLENKGREAGAAADHAIERVGDGVDAAKVQMDNGAANVADKAHDVKQDIKHGLNKADNAVDAAAAELKK